MYVTCITTYINYIESNASSDDPIEGTQQEEEEEKSLTEDQKHLKDMISKTLSDRMNEMKVSSYRNSKL